MRRSSLLSFSGLLLIVLLAILTAHTQPFPSDQPATLARTFTFTYQLHVPATTDAHGKLYIWLPLPQQDDDQEIDVIFTSNQPWHTRRGATPNTAIRSSCSNQLPPRPNLDSTRRSASWPHGANTKWT